MDEQVENERGHGDPVEYIPVSMSQDLTNLGDGKSTTNLQVEGSPSEAPANGDFSVEIVESIDTDGDITVTEIVVEDDEVEVPEAGGPTYGFVNVAYWGINIASIQETDNGGTPNNPITFASQNSLAMGSTLLLTQEGDIGSRNLTITLWNEQSSGTLVITAYGAGESDCTWVSVGANA